MTAIQEAAVTIDRMGWEAHQSYAEREAERPVAVPLVDFVIEAEDVGIQPGEPMRSYVELLLQTYVGETFAQFPKRPKACMVGAIPSLSTLAEWEARLETTAGKGQKAVELMVKYIREELAGNAKRIGFGVP